MEFEAECIAGLERFAADEMGIPYHRGAPGAVPFSYDGPWAEPLGLRAVVAVHAILGTGLPRPSVLLDDGAFRKIVAAVGHIRSLHPAGAFRTFRLSAAGSDSSVFKRFGARLAGAGQWADDALPAVERFIVGGADFGRAYPVALLAREGATA